MTCILPHIGALLILVILCNAIEFMDGAWVEYAWYTPATAAGAIFCFLEALVWTFYLCFWRPLAI